MEKKATFKELALGRTDVFMIDPNIIQANEEDNLRIEYGDIESLADYITENGVPGILTVYMDKSGNVKLSDGFRRIRACKILAERGTPVVSVPCRREERNTTEEQRIVNILASAEGKNLSLLEQGIGYKRLKNLGWTPQMISKKIAKSLPHVYQGLELAGAPEKIKEEIQKGNISSSEALKVIKGAENSADAVGIVTDAIQKAKSNGRKRATNADVQAVTPSPAAPSNGKINYKAAIKSLEDWIEENSLLLAENEGYKAVCLVPDLLSGKITEKEFTKAIRN